MCCRTLASLAVPSAMSCDNSVSRRSRSALAACRAGQLAWKTSSMRADCSRRQAQFLDEALGLPPLELAALPGVDRAWRRPRRWQAPAPGAANDDTMADRARANAGPDVMSYARSAGAVYPGRGGVGRRRQQRVEEKLERRVRLGAVLRAKAHQHDPAAGPPASRPGRPGPRCARRPVASRFAAASRARRRRPRGRRRATPRPRRAREARSGQRPGRWQKTPRPPPAFPRRAGWRVDLEPQQRARDREPVSRTPASTLPIDSPNAVSGSSDALSSAISVPPDSTGSSGPTRRRARAGSASMASYVASL